MASCHVTVSTLDCVLVGCLWFVLHTSTLAGDVWFLGGHNILKGYRSRAKGPYAAILRGQTDYPFLNTLSVEERILVAAFTGNDYTRHLNRFSVGKKSGSPGPAVTAALSYAGLPDIAARSTFLTTLESSSRWSGSGTVGQATGFAHSVLRSINIFSHYPVYTILWSGATTR